MTTFATAWAATAPQIASRPLNDAYTVPSGTGYPVNGYPYAPEPPSLIVDGMEPSLGFGQFVYGQWSNATGCTAGSVCEMTQTTYTSGTSVSIITSFQLWQGTANKGLCLAVAVTALAQNQFGWFQLYGAALVNVSAESAGSSAYWEANGVVSSTVVASKQMLNATCLVAPSASFGPLGATLSSTQAILFINYPFGQGAIT